jgi:hypothetical protein
MKINTISLQITGVLFTLLFGTAQADEQHQQSGSYSQDVPILYYDSEGDIYDYHFEITTESCNSECLPPTCETPPCNEPPCPPPPCPPPCPVKQDYRLVADTGYLHQPESAGYIFGRFGVEYSFSKQFDGAVMIGGVPKIGGDEGKSALTVDVLGQYNWLTHFVGMGFGAWLTSGDDDLVAEDSGLDLIAHIGTRLDRGLGSLDTSVFLEARSALDELDEITEYGRFGIGLRFRF